MVYRIIGMDYYFSLPATQNGWCECNFKPGTVTGSNDAIRQQRNRKTGCMVSGNFYLWGPCKIEEPFAFVFYQKRPEDGLIIYFCLSKICKICSFGS